MSDTKKRRTYLLGVDTLNVLNELANKEGRKLSKIIERAIELYNQKSKNQ